MKNLKRFLSFALALLMLSAINMTAFAAEDGGAWYDEAVSYVKENGFS